jgi:hypothetical protein
VRGIKIADSSGLDFRALILKQNTAKKYVNDDIGRAASDINYFGQITGLRPEVPTGLRIRSSPRRGLRKSQVSRKFGPRSINNSLLNSSEGSILL